MPAVGEGPYEVLGVAPDASLAAIRSAYRALARRTHPDAIADPLAGQRFKVIAEAYALVSDPERRATYDRMRSMAPRRRRSTGRDVRLDLSLGFVEAALGVEKSARFRVSADCPACEGTGCRHCGEKGLVRVERELVVRIPPGIEDATTQRIQGEGEPGRRGGLAGDLVLTVSIEPHPLLTRDGRDVHLELPTTPVEAALGADIEVPTLDGVAVLRIRPGTQSGRVLRLRGRGIPLPAPRKGRGDQLVRVVVETPVHPSVRQRAILSQLAEVGGLAAYPRRRAFVRRLMAEER